MDQKVGKRKRQENEVEALKNVSMCLRPKFCV